MARVSLKKYGFENRPDDNFSDDGAYFFASEAVINNCNVRSTICYDDCGQDYIFRDFDVVAVNGITKYKFPYSVQAAWHKLEREYNLSEFNGCKKWEYTPEAVANLMKRMDECTKSIAILVECVNPTS